MKIKKKIWPEYFAAIQNGSKNFEIRLANFDCQPGDILVLEEWDPKIKQYTGHSIERDVTYVLKTKDLNFWPKEETEKYGLQIISLKPRQLPKIIVSALIQKNDKYLLVKEILENGKEYWIIPGGTVEFGEELNIALKREIKEETNLDIKIENFLDFHEAIFPEYNYHTVIFFYQASPLNENIVLDDKIIEARYFFQEEIKSLNLVSSASWLFKKLDE